MKHVHSWKTVLFPLVALLAASVANAALVTFNPTSSVGSVGISDLNSATTSSGGASGASWTENIAPGGGSTDTPANLFADDGAGSGDFGWIATSGNGSDSPEYVLDLGTNDFDFSSSATTVSMNFDITRGSTGRNISILGYDSNSNLVFDMAFLPGGTDDIYVDGDGDLNHELLGAAQLGGGSGVGELDNGNYTTYSDGITNDITITLNGTSLTYSIVGNTYTHTTTVLNNASDLSSILIGSGGSNGGGWRLDDLVVSGTAVPEPSSFALLSLGLGALFLRRRRR
jgi:hypothetical protein